MRDYSERGIRFSDPQYHLQKAYIYCTPTITADGKRQNRSSRTFSLRQRLQASHVGLQGLRAACPDKYVMRFNHVLPAPCVRTLTGSHLSEVLRIDRAMLLPRRSAGSPHDNGARLAGSVATREKLLRTCAGKVASEHSQHTLKTKAACSQRSSVAKSVAWPCIHTTENLENTSATDEPLSSTMLVDTTLDVEMQVLQEPIDHAHQDQSNAI